MSWWRTLALALGLRRALDVDPGPPMKLVVGLGNPGRKYERTRHNVGYAVIDCLADRHEPASFRHQFEGQAASMRIDGDKVLLLKPETYMNLSGRSVRQALEFYDLEPSQLLVVCDDLNIPLGTLRIRPDGSHGGQKGLLSIADELGSTEYHRLRVGIGPLPERRDRADFVLERFRDAEQTVIDEAVGRAADAVGVWCRCGVHECMNRFN